MPSRKSKSLAVLMGVNDSFYLGPGWHALASDERYDLPYRPTMGRAELMLPKTELARRLSVLITSSPQMLRKPVSVRLIVNEREICEKQISTDLWRVWRVALPNGLNSDKLHVFFETRECFVPDRYLHNGDHRAMGVYVSALRLD